MGKVEAGLLGFLLGVVCGMLLIALLEELFDETYKDGQIDALSGKIKYELVRHDNHTVTWEPKQ